MTTAFQIQIRVTKKSEAVRLSKELERAAREFSAAPTIERYSAAFNGLVMSQRGRHFTFTYQGLTVRYFVRYGEHAAVITGMSSLFGAHPAPVQRHIDATLAAYAEKLNGSVAA